ncbi:MAG: hypothetical protein PHH37_06255 [Paludibacter sp.]|nr:hypothetical protein [Paludibacter sp.]
MKKYVMLALTVIFSMSFVLNAQDQRPPRGERGPEGKRMEITAKDRAERLAKQLELTEEQKAKVQALYEKQDKKREEMRAEAKEQREKADKSREEMREKMEAERKANDTELESIIGKDKMTQLKQIREERMKRMQERRSDRRSDDEGPKPE